MSKLEIIRNLKNTEGKRLCTKNRLEYAREIIKLLEEQPDNLLELLELLEVTDKELYAYLSGDKIANITLYDQALSHLVKKRRILNKG